MTLEEHCADLIRLLDEEQDKLTKKRENALRSIALVLDDKQAWQQG
jgi:hypothetical protein